MLILRELLFYPNSKFTQLNIQGLTSDHFSYHINVLMDLGYVSKDDGKYSLTPKGKEFANQMDTDMTEIEKQPKIAVMVVAKRMRDGNVQVLVQERTKEPYYGYKGFITGKIRFGERVIETAQRELKEESGLDCEDFQIKRIVHNFVRLTTTGELVEDKMFYIVVANEPTGDIVDTMNGKNEWVTVAEFADLDKKYYDEDNIFKYAMEEGEMDFAEESFFVEEF